MQLQLNTDSHLRGSPAFADRVAADIEAALERFSRRITRVEMHLNDENGAGAGDADKRCQVEARIAGRTPVSVTHLASTWDLAVSGALDKLAAALEHAFGKLDASQRGAARHGDPGGDADVG